LSSQRNQLTSKEPHPSPIAGGHSVLVGGYGSPALPSPALGGDEKFITWAQETSFTDRFWAMEMEECWAVIWPEHLGSKEFLAGVDLAAFAADYTAITGKPFPAPAPVPVPVPPPASADDALEAVAGPWAAKSRTRPDLITLQAAIRAWETAKGY